MTVLTDYPGVRDPDWGHADLAVLLSEAARLEAGQKGDFSTALHDAERRYLDIMAELYRRDELPGVERCECCGLQGMHNSLQALVARKALLEKEKQ
jgi:hypothetical protein